MQIVEFNKGDLILKWKELPDPYRGNLKLRDKVLKELKDNFSEVFVDSKILFQMNQYVINRLKQEK